MSVKPFFSIIIPVYNGGEPFKRCLAAIRQADFTDWELMVVDDGSTDGSDRLARQFGAVLFKTAGRQGPAAARNLGARLARGSYLFFIDADCELHPDTFSRTARHFETDPDLDALFGSYDDSPGASNFLAQYKNLFHHYVHQHSQPAASTFWTGCGAIKRSLFLTLGGFDVQRYRRPSIEDIDLGFRLKQRGGRIMLTKEVQVKHLKAWTFLKLLRSDILDRGIPWTRLMLRRRAFLSDLNLQTHNRASVVVLYAFLMSLGLTVFQPLAIIFVLVLGLWLLWLNAALYRFFYQKRGLSFTLKAIPLHWFYYFYNAISFGCGLLIHWQTQFKPDRLPAPQALVDVQDIDGPG